MLNPNQISSDVEVRSICKSYTEGAQKRVVLDGLDLSFDKGEFVALVGPSGSGKSTLLHLLCGIDLPDSGDIKINGHHINHLSEHERTLFRRRHIGLVFQFFNLLETLTVRENLLLPLQLNHIESAIAEQRISDYLRRVQLSEKANQFPEQLSGGEQQRIAIGRALLHQPSLILADEPTGNLDDANAKAILGLLQELCAERNIIVVMATHSADAIDTAHRSVRLTFGRTNQV